MYASMSLERDGKGKQIFHIAPAASAAAHGHRGFAARQQDAWRGEWLIALRHLVCDACKYLAPVLGFTLHGIAQYMRFDSCIASHGCGSLQGHLRRGYVSGAGMRKPR